MSRARREWLRGAAALLLAAGMHAGLRAQDDWRRVAVPMVTPDAFVDGVWRRHALPRAAALAASAQRLADALRALAAGSGNLGAAQQAWRAALGDWAALNAVAIGPLVERRSARRIDFSPTRPEQVRRAIERLAAATTLEPEQIGSAAKGFGALEWLLWHADAPSDGPARRYAVFIADELAAEALALQQGFAAAARQRSDEEAVAANSEIVNQWIGGIEALRLQHFERPLSEARQRGRDQPVLPRALADAAVAERQRRWDALSALTRFAPGSALPVPMQDLVPIETLLRGRGLNPLADQLSQAARRAGDAIAAASDNAPDRLQAAAQALAELKLVAEADVASRLDVRVGFSDADGD